MSWYVLSDDGKESLKRWNNDVASSKSNSSIVDEAPPLIIIHKEYTFDISHQIQSLMKRFLRKNRRLRERLTKTKKRIIETIQLFNAATLQQMSEEKKKKKNKKMINVGEKSAKNVKMKRIVKEKFSKKKENFDTMMFEIVDVKDSNVIIFMKYHIDDTTTISNSFTKEKSSKKNENESFEKTKKKKTDE